VTGVATEVNPVLAALAAQHPDNNGPSVRAPRGFTDKDSKPGDDTFEFTVFTTANPADLAITAGTASGHVGDTVTVSGTVENHGPADSPSITVIITAPTGTEIVDAPHCDPVAPGRIVKCEAPLAAGDGFAEDVKFKITSSTVGNDGTAVVSGPLADPNLDNNTAAIKITVLPSGEPGGLPVTGVKVAVIGAVGLAGVVVGWLLFAATRRRRVVMVTPGDETTEK